MVIESYDTHLARRTGTAIIITGIYKLPSRLLHFFPRNIKQLSKQYPNRYMRIMAKLKVYGWRGSRKECPAAKNGNKQTREVCVSPSKSKISKATGVPISEICETGNEIEIQVAWQSPGIIYFAPINTLSRAITDYTPTNQNILL
jgi:hypothetical protein